MAAAMLELVYQRYSKPRAPAPTPSPQSEPTDLFSLSRPRPGLDMSIFSSSLGKLDASTKALKSLVDLVDERATFFETLELLGAGESRNTIENTTPKLFQTWSGAARLENKGHKAVTRENDNGGDKDEEADTEKVIEGELKR